MFMDWILLAIGFVFLVKGADLLVDGAHSVARKMGVSALVIGLTVVAFGTSAPELVVNIFASSGGNTDIAIGNVLGSNIANIFLVLGVASVIYPIKVGHGTVWREIPFSLFAVVLLAILANDALLRDGIVSEISRGDGFVLLTLFVLFMYYTFSIRKLPGKNGHKVTASNYSYSKSSLYIFIGLLGLTLGGKWIVDSAVSIASSFGVSQSLIAVTVVAFGTSLPELVTSAVAATKKNVDIAVGNIVGSNIFNIFWILGISAAIKPIPVSANINRDVFMVVVASLILFLLMFVGRKHVFERWQGAFFVFLYVSYLAFIISSEIFL